MLNGAKLISKLWRGVSGGGSVRRHSGVPDKYPKSFRTYLATLPAPESTVLCNGVTVVSEYRELCHATVGIFFDAGSRYEDQYNNGIAHFFEQIAFKGSNTRKKEVTECQMSCTGARFRSFTSREMVGYYAECLCEDVTVVVDLLADGLFCNCFDYKELELQKNILYLEMTDADKNAQNVLFDYLHATAYQGTSLAQSVIGPSNNLYNFCGNTIQRYQEKFFRPPRIVITSVGGVTHSHLVNVAQTYLGNLHACKCYAQDIYRFTGSQVIYRDDSKPMANVAIAFEIPSFCDNDMYTLEVARTMVGSWDQRQPCGDNHANYLAQASCVQHHSSAYESFMITYKDCGLWGIHFMTHSKHLEDMTESIGNIWMNLCRTTVDLEVTRAKRQAKTRLLRKFQGTTATCIDLARWMLYKGCRPTLIDRVTAIERVDAQDIRDMMTHYMYDRSPVVAAVGPTEGLPEYNRICSLLYWLRY